MSGGSSHIGTLLRALAQAEEVERFTAARATLRRHLLMTRDTPIGRDFLFPAAEKTVRTALKDLVEIEHKHGGELHFDYAALNDYFLLRIVGEDELRKDIESYFD